MKLKNIIKDIGLVTLGLGIDVIEKRKARGFLNEIHKDANEFSESESYEEDQLAIFEKFFKYLTGFRMNDVQQQMFVDFINGDYVFLRKQRQCGVTLFFIVLMIYLEFCYDHKIAILSKHSFYYKKIFLEKGRELCKKINWFKKSFVFNENGFREIDKNEIKRYDFIFAALDGQESFSASENDTIINTRATLITFGTYE